MSEIKLKGNDVVMDNKVSLKMILNDNQPNSVSDSNIIDTNFVVEDIEIKEETSFTIENEETESENLNFLLSEPFTLEENVSFVDKEFEGNTTEKNSKIIQVGDIIDNTVNNEMSLDKLSPNLDQGKSLVDDTSIEYDDSKVDAEDCALLDLNINQVEKTTECTLDLQQDKAKQENIHVVKRSIRNRRSLGKMNSNDRTIPVPRRKKKKIEMSELSVIATSNRDSSETSLPRDSSSKNEKLKCMESKVKNICMETEIKIKPCSIFIEKTIANHMNAKDVCMVSHIHNLKDCIVLKAKPQLSTTTELEVNKRAQPNISFSESVTGINKSALIFGNVEKLESDIKSKYEHPMIESTSKTEDTNLSKGALSATFEQNDIITTISLHSAQEPNNLNHSITSSNIPTKDLKQTKYLNLVHQTPSESKQNNITDPKQTSDNSINPLPQEATIGLQEVLPLGSIKQMLKSKQKESPPDNDEAEIKDRQISPQSEEVSVIQLIENKAKVISPSHYNEYKINDTLTSQQSSTENVEHLIENLKGNKALSLQPVIKNASITSCSITSFSTFSSTQNASNSITPIQNSSTSLTAPTSTSSKKLPKEQLNDKSESKPLNLKELLEGAPPFIQEVFKCDNIRDGFINEDLIFVLSILPDMEEMSGSEKIQFQLRVIETITDVFKDPVLNL